MSEIWTSMCLDFGIVWISDIQFSAFHCITIIMNSFFILVHVRIISEICYFFFSKTSANKKMVRSQQPDQTESYCEHVFLWVIYYFLFLKTVILSSIFSLLKFRWDKKFDSSNLNHFSKLRRLNRLGIHYNWYERNRLNRHQI